MCQAIPESRLRLLAGHLQALGPRSVLEYLREILAGADPIERLERYAELDPAIVAAVDGIECISILADNDTNGAGKKAASELQRRWLAAGHEARVWLPKSCGDLNDILMGRA
jgi:hypothetical protein